MTLPARSRRSRSSRSLMAVMWSLSPFLADERGEGGARRTGGRLPRRATLGRLAHAAALPSVPPGAAVGAAARRGHHRVEPRLLSRRSARLGFDTQAAAL